MREGEGEKGREGERAKESAKETAKETSTNYAVTPALSAATSAVIAATSTTPPIPLSTSNAVALRKVTGAGLALIVAGSVFVVL